MTYRQLTEKLVTCFLNDNPDLVGEAAHFHCDGEHLFLPEHLGGLFQQWLIGVIDPHGEEPAEEGDPYTAMLNEFLAEHPQHIAGTQVKVVNGEEQLMTDLEATRAFVAWAKGRGLCQYPDKADSALAELDRLAADRTVRVSRRHRCPLAAGNGLAPVGMDRRLAGSSLGTVARVRRMDGGKWLRSQTRSQSPDIDAPSEWEWREPGIHTRISGSLLRPP